MSEGNDILKWPRGCLDFSSGCLVMGILNVTPDSFSDGGKYLCHEAAIEHGLKMAREGAAIIDIGPESTRPGAAPVPAEEQIRRAIPVIKALREKLSIPLSIDTRIPEAAEKAIEAGASIINDITALADERMAKLAAQHQLPVILMHMQGTPATMQQSPSYRDVVGEVLEFLLKRAERAETLGIPRERIIIDPGIGFGKTFDHNLSLLNNIGRFTTSGYRVLVGASRKRFLSHITGRPTAELGAATATTTAWCAYAGVSIVRVHDVAEAVDVCKVVRSIRKEKV